ncbi:hypothetical protein P7I04_13115 [Lactococcus lactis]|uniref:Uncharacterized protein n=1 Tax=Lactococcus lactis TaxID=1358 RepID=A0AAW8UE68_9LACT|nr:hypothetical protein [Lactococcus lactis]MDT2946962.1 hypothetical protein [Lactococcus lactis]
MAHNYTTSSFEQNSLLRSGWKYGNVAWKAISPGITISSGQIPSANNTNQMGQGEYRPPMLHPSQGQVLGGWSGEVR